MKHLVRYIPLALFMILGLLLYRGLFLNPQAMPSAMINKPLPDFNLTLLLDESKQVSKVDLKGKIILLNVWATWCPTCRTEHPYLLQLARNPRVSLYGINYKDEREAAQRWLVELKNPYQFTLFDQQGDLGLDLGVFGAPETFVIDHKGLIRKRFAGAINGNVWRQEFLPLITTIEAEIFQEEG